MIGNAVFGAGMGAASCAGMDAAILADKNSIDL